MKEVWKPTQVRGYEVSNFGRVRSLDMIVNSSWGSMYRKKGRVLKPGRDKDGYLFVGLRIIGRLKHKYLKVHRLVAMAFISNPLNKPQINHKDGDKSFNHYLNLEWATQLENIRHGVRMGLIKGTSHVGQANGASKLKNEDIIRIRKDKRAAKFLAVIYKVCIGTIYHIRQNKRWNHIK